MQTTLNPGSRNVLQKETPLASSVQIKTGNTLVICYGNPLRGDDGFAWHVAQKLTKANLEQLEVVMVHQLLPELAESIAQAQGVVFVDASLEIPAGQISLQKLKPVVPLEIFSHHLEPAKLLGVAQMLYGRVPTTAMAVSVGVQSLGYTEPLSLEVEVAIPKVLKAIQRIFVNS
jgi:hydrogenase maturation protease